MPNTIADASVWLDFHSKTTFPQLNKDLEADIVVVGGGIHGVVATYLLAKAHQKVVLLEQDTIGSGDTGYTTAFVSYVIDKDLSSLIKTFGRAKAQRIWQACQTAIAELAELIQREKIACDFEWTDLTVYAADQNGWETLQKEAEAARSLGFEVSLSQDPSFPLSKYGHLIAPKNAKFHPLKFVTQLAQRAQAAGAQIHEKTMVKQFDHGTLVTLHTDRATVTARQVLFATGTPINSPIFLQSKIKPSNTYVIAGQLGTSSLPEGLYIDTETPYHYLRVDRQKTGYRFILGGEDHPTGSQKPTDDVYQKLADYLRHHLTTDFAVTHQWGGQILTSVDGLPYIGRHPLHRNEFVGTCFGGDGMTFGILSGLINADLLMGQSHQYSDLFKLTRLTGMWEFMKRGVKMSSNMIKSHLPQSGRDFNQLKSGEGTVIEKNGHKIAVHRNEKGEIIAISAVCTHLGCIVNWNQAQQTWDCPCHGSRFSATGEVLRGPATEPLKPESL